MRAMPATALYQSVQAAFDALAPGYDRAFGSAVNQVMAQQRHQSLGLLNRTFDPGTHLLEIGCGSGVEAVALARGNRTIAAIDVSPVMIEESRRRAQASNLSRQISFHCGAAAPVVQTLAQTGAHFDGAYSSFGALNCEPDLEGLASGLADLLLPGSLVVLSLINRWCLWEIAWFLAHGQTRPAWRRQTGEWSLARMPLVAPTIAGATSAPTATVGVPLRYYGLADLQRAFAPAFRLETITGLGVVIPPPHLNQLVARRPRAARILFWLDDRLSTQPLFRRLGDHLAMVFRRDRSF